MKSPPSTLEELVAPLAESEFLELLRTRKITLVRGSEPHRYTPLMNWAMLRGMLDRGEHPNSLVEFRLTRESVMVPPEHYLRRSRVREGNEVDPAKVDAFLAQGFSLIITPLDPYAPHLAALSADIRARLRERIKIGVVVGSGTGGALKLHYDPEDLIILQVEGSKRWRIYGPVVSNPVIGMPKPPTPREVAPIFDDVLHAGDFLFVPGGNWHHCDNGPSRSLHLGIFFAAPTAWHVVKAFTSQLLDDELFRTPLTRLDGTTDRAAMEAEFKNRAIERIRHMELDAFVSDWAKPPGP